MITWTHAQAPLTHTADSSVFSHLAPSEPKQEFWKNLCYGMAIHLPYNYWVSNARLIDCKWQRTISLIAFLTIAKGWEISCACMLRFTRKNTAFETRYTVVISLQPACMHACESAYTIILSFLTLSHAGCRLTIKDTVSVILFRAIWCVNKSLSASPSINFVHRTVMLTLSLPLWQHKYLRKWNIQTNLYLSIFC